MTPTAGLRLGLTFASGDYVTGEELTVPQNDGRGLRMIAFEGEYSFGYTRVSGEVVRDRLEKAVGADTAYTWFVQGTQTLTPRWFVAARQEGASAPPLHTGAVIGSRPSLHTTEATVGYPSITRVHRARQLRQPQELHAPGLGSAGRRVPRLGPALVVGPQVVGAIQSRGQVPLPPRGLDLDRVQGTECVRDPNRESRSA